MTKNIESSNDTSTANHSTPVITQQEREAFWSHYGWTADMPENERNKLETFWDDEAINMAHSYGF